MPLIEAKNLSKSYGAIRAVHAVSFTVDRGEVVGFEGSRALVMLLTEAEGVSSGVRVVAAAGGAPIVSFTVEDYDPAEVAVAVEQAAGVQVRSGFHCAAAVHPHLGTACEGTVRASFGPFNSVEDVQSLVTAVAALVT